MECLTPLTMHQVEKRPQGHRSSKKIRACTPCRQQKLRCDASTSASKSCSRCVANDTPCYFSATFERQKARSKAELQREIEMLRHQAQAPPPQTLEQSNDRSSTSAVQAESHEMRDGTLYGDATLQIQPAGLALASTSSPETTFAPEPAPPPVVAALTTHTRALEGVYVDAFKINDCFALFFKHYHPVLPILDPSWGPDTFYTLSPLVFWCIVVTGSRRYDLDPTILHRLAPGVSQMALRSLPQFSSYFPTICGLVMLCVWPLPMKTMHEDLSPLYSGAAMQIALQHGLHLSPHSQACGWPGSVRNVTHDASLARVWAYVEFVCHCTSWTTGSPTHFFADAFDYGYYTDDVAKTISPSTRWMQRLDRLCSRANMTLSEVTYAMDTDSGRGAALGGLIKVFDEQIQDISQKALGDISCKTSKPGDTASASASAGAGIYPNSMIATISRVQVNAYHFLGNDPSVNYPGLIELFHLACRWTEQATALDHATDWALYSSESYFRHTVLVASIILRISHSHQLKAKVDLGTAERGYFATVRLLKRRSLQSGDVNAQAAQLLSELWHNDFCFKGPDGMYDSLYVRIRRRGVMGVAFDCLWSSSREHRETGHEGCSNHFQPTRATSSPDTGPGFTAAPSLFELPTPAENEMLDFMNGSSFDLLYNNFQWTQDDGFWA